MSSRPVLALGLSVTPLTLAQPWPDAVTGISQLISAELVPPCLQRTKPCLGMWPHAPPKVIAGGETPEIKPEPIH